jgi:hypothetical protein
MVDKSPHCGRVAITSQEVTGTQGPELEKAGGRYNGQTPKTRLICPIKIMTALPKVSATETADLRDVHKRLAKQSYAAYVAHLLGDGFYRIERWIETKIYPKGWF